MAGYALSALAGDHSVPWQRVINARGEISRRGDREWERFQRTLLEEEGVSFNTAGRVDLRAFRWRPTGDP
jgi:methylated-DNA-protein-cysteine methyltransferase-like protein